MLRNRPRRTLLVLLFAGLLRLAACGGGAAGADDHHGPLVLLDLSVADTGGVPLNATLRFEFSGALDPATVRPDTLLVREGAEQGAAVPGSFRVDGRFVDFLPRLPVRPDLSDAGLQPGTDYVAIVRGGDDPDTVRSTLGAPVARPSELRFATAPEGSDRLFTDDFLDPAPPRVIAVNPADGATGVPAGGEIVLTFNRRPLHPATLGDGALRLLLVRRRGERLDRPVAGEFVLAQTRESVRVRFAPEHPLADEALYRLEWSRRITDLVGRDVADPGRGDRAFLSEFTVRDEPPRDGRIRLEFTAAERATIADPDATTASWSGAVPGALAAAFTAGGGDGRCGDLHVVSDRTIGPDDVPGEETIVEDGVRRRLYRFRRFAVDEGATLRLVSGGESLPVEVRSIGPVRIDGTVTVSGGPGQDGTAYPGYTYRLNPARSGGAAGPGGGRGAASFAGGAWANLPPQDGDDGAGGAGGGRGGGAGHDANGTYVRSNGGGGGGGGARTAGGDGQSAAYVVAASDGAGGKGGSGAPDGDDGETWRAVGGGGGGAGGPGFSWSGGAVQVHRPGGGGGGGGGAIWIRSAARIDVGAKGAVLAEGGPGGGTGSGSSSFHGGAGGGGGGGSVRLTAPGGVAVAAGGTVSVVGGAGGPWLASSSQYAGARGGGGAGGRVRLEAASAGGVSVDPDAEVTPGALAKGTYEARGAGAPSVGQTRWIDLGVFDAEMLPPAAGDLVGKFAPEEVSVEVQMAVEDPAHPEQPLLAPDAVSDWTPLAAIEGLNGRHYRFVRVRVEFQLGEDHAYGDPVPYLDRLDLRYRF